MSTMESEQADGVRERRILLVEDNFLLARMLRRVLDEGGFEVVGPVASVSEAVELAHDGTLEGAVLDVNVKGGHTGPVAEMLLLRHCPLVFVTGYASPRVLPEALQRQPRLHKPIEPEVLIRTVREWFDR